MEIKKTVSALMLMGAVTVANADVCTIIPGSVTCGSGVVKTLSGNGMVSVNGTTVEGMTTVNGMLTAGNATFASLMVNGSASLTMCTIKNDADIKGSLQASSTTFENSLDIYSSSSRLNNTKIMNNLNVHHTDNKKQEIHLSGKSEVGGNVTFDDGDGKIFVSSGSKIKGRVVGGEVINN